ncbi:hypothetical protein [Comamonas koreensis]|uniref:Uncharacterized protein n=1 Tax=Comamonas koreensis TaxID=160825 RepID=A0AAW4XYA1_9BURK|nr:hypothetical protein [Comamonas koreensis]MCD2166658.1 hypothetical protein [Comamonas koreensis]
MAGRDTAAIKARAAPAITARRPAAKEKRADIKNSEQSEKQLLTRQNDSTFISAAQLSSEYEPANLRSLRNYRNQLIPNAYIELGSRAHAAKSRLSREQAARHKTADAIWHRPESLKTQGRFQTWITPCNICASESAAAALVPGQIVNVKASSTASTKAIKEAASNQWLWW